MYIRQDKRYTIHMPAKPKYPLPDVNSTIGENVARIRKEKGISQLDLAEKLQISQQLLSHYEVGRLHITAEMLTKIAKVLETSTDEILNLKESSSKNDLSLRFTRRIRELESLPENKKKAILQVLDDLIRANS